MVPILYEDNHLLVVTKPHNMPTQEDQSRDNDLLRTLKLYIKETYNKPGNVYLGLVHRLDRPAGGVMVFAKTSKAASRLANSMRLQHIHRYYLAVVHGQPPQNKDKLVHYLTKDNATNTVTAVAQYTPGAKQAMLTYEVLDRNMTHGLCLVKVQLHTGRPHQIRVQFKEIGCPLYGDQKYGAQVNEPGQQMALWAAQLSLPHPTTKETLSFSAMPQLKSHFPWSIWPESRYYY